MLKNYIGVQTTLGRPETDKLFRYLARCAKMSLLYADYVTASPETNGNIALVNIRVRPNLLERVAKSVGVILPHAKIGVVS